MKLAKIYGFVVLFLIVAGFSIVALKEYGFFGKSADMETGSFYNEDHEEKYFASFKIYDKGKLIEQFGFSNRSEKEIDLIIDSISKNYRVIH